MTAPHATDWRDLLAEVPREPFLPDVVWIDGPDRTFVPVSRQRDPQRWADATRGDQPVITQVDNGAPPPGQPGVIPTSSASMPTVVAGMLDALGAEASHTVLEVGTGTGWNAALLARRVGPTGRVVSVEIDPELADTARNVLATAGANVDVITGDGERGYPDGAPYDRIIATASARAIPFTWVQQARTGAVIVTPWGTDYCNGTLARLVVGPAGVAFGRFHDGYSFMRLRSQRRYLVNPDRTGLDTTTAEHSITDLDGRDVYRMITASEAAFAIGLQVPDCRMLFEEDRRGQRHHVVELHDTASGSWAVVDVDVDRGRGFDVHQAGARRLWDEAVDAYRWWLAHDTPGVERFGITITAVWQAVWLNDPASEHRWIVG